MSDYLNELSDLIEYYREKFPNMSDEDIMKMAEVELEDES